MECGPQECTINGKAHNQGRTPTTAELLLAAHSGCMASPVSSGLPGQIPRSFPSGGHCTAAYPANVDGGASWLIPEALPGAASLPSPGQRAPVRAASPAGKSQGAIGSPVHRPSNLSGVVRPKPAPPAFSLFSARPQVPPPPSLLLNKVQVPLHSLYTANTLVTST